ncbi:MAG: hypothetical protein ACRCYX_01565 [Dermatophilaceae bacterium]
MIGAGAERPSGGLSDLDTTGPTTDFRRARNQVAACVEAVSRLQLDLRVSLPDAAQHLDLALGDLLDAYDATDQAITTTRANEPEPQ